MGLVVGVAARVVDIDRLSGVVVVHYGGDHSLLALGLHI